MTPAATGNPPDLRAWIEAMRALGGPVAVMYGTACLAAPTPVRQRAAPKYASSRRRWSAVGQKRSLCAR